jgi:hypothetical protein
VLIGLPLLLRLPTLLRLHRRAARLPGGGAVRGGAVATLGAAVRGLDACVATG